MIKRIDLMTGAKTSMPLRAEAHFNTALVTDPDGREFAEHVLCDGVSWFHVARKGKRWLLHGSVMSSGSALYVFMEHPEARHAELEAAISRAPGAAEVYADWLEEQGDPFAGALKPALAKARGPAGLWWLEGFERTGAVTTTVRDGFLREAQVGVIPASELLGTVHRLCHLRACLALERLVIDPRSLGERGWASIFSWSMWTDCRWPSSLRSLSFAPHTRGQKKPTPHGRDVMARRSKRVCASKAGHRSPLESRSRINDTQMRWPLMQGFPKQTFGSMEIRASSSSRDMVRRG